MLDQCYRPLYQKFFIDPLLKCNFFKKIHPITLTILGCLFGICVLPLLIGGHPFMALTVLSLSGFLDTLDGSLARTLKLTSAQGAVSDIVCDRIVEFCIVLGLYLADPINRGLLSLLMLGSILLCVTTFLVVGIFTSNHSQKSFFYSPGLIERAEAFIFFALMILFPSLFALLAIFFIVLTLFTALLRWWQFLKYARF